MSVGQILLIIISGLGIFHGLFLAIILWSAKPSTNIASKVLGILMLILSLRIGKSVLMAFTDHLPIVYVYVGLCLMLFIGPLLQLYSITLIHRTQHIDPKAFLHFLPGVLFILSAIPLEEIGFRNIPDFIGVMLFATIYLHFLGYILYVKQKVIPQATLTPAIKTWLNILFIGLLAIWLEYVLNLFEEQIPYILGPIVYSITVYYITYLAFTHKYLTAIQAVKYQTAGTNEKEAAALFELVEKLMQQEMLYLDSNLNLASLSKRLKVSSQKLSMVINSRSNVNFNEYLNGYRIAYAQQMLQDESHSSLSIAAIAYDAGFNSLSTFNTAFKKLTGKTPSRFRNAIG